MIKSSLTPHDVAARIQTLRKRSGLSIRQLAKRADVSQAMLSYVEQGKNSMSLTTLEKVLIALGTSLDEFFTNGEREVSGSGPVFAREQMRVVSDTDRTYTMLLGNRPSAQLGMFDEHIRPAKKKPEYTKHECDVAGYVLSGSLILEVKGEKKRSLRTGDAFYLPKGTMHRGYAPEGEEARLITVSYPAT